MTKVWDLLGRLFPFFDLVVLLALVSMSDVTLSRSIAKRAEKAAPPFPGPAQLITDPDAETDSYCPALNNTQYNNVLEGFTYTIVCNVDYPDQDIMPYLHVDSYINCINACTQYNTDAANDHYTTGELCRAAIFVPERMSGVDNCYLKHGIDHAIPTEGFVKGALWNSFGMRGGSDNAEWSVDSDEDGLALVKKDVFNRNIISTPRITYTQLHGPTRNTPSSQYVDYVPSPGPKLEQRLLVNGVDTMLTTDYPMAVDTGVLDINDTTRSLIKNLDNVPTLSRDGGKGGVLDGEHVFIFCDTGSYSTAVGQEGSFLGFVGSSIATDTGMHALYGNSITLQDGIGQWSDDVGRMRGFVPMTQGEEGFNVPMQGANGQRIAVWPESSLIPLSGKTGVLFAPIIYDSVKTMSGVPSFTNIGMTLLTITAGSPGGPVAERTNSLMFTGDEIQWGSKGGIRSWGPSGVGGTDGRVYIFGETRNGLHIARVDADNIANRDSYEYWTGSAWSHGMQGPDSTSYFITGMFQDVDMFYSELHKTIFMVYMNIFADNTFYYRYLNVSSPIMTPFNGGDSNTDYVENILTQPWSKEQVLYEAPPSTSGRYVYAGGVHQGYFGADDITNGGTKMLLSWTAPTGQLPSSSNSEYQILTAEVNWA